MRLIGAIKIGAIMVGAAAVGMACGSSSKKVTAPMLPEAGSAKDDGSGILALTSGTKIKLGPQEDENGGNTYGSTDYQDPYYDDPYYSDPYYSDPYYGGGYYYGGYYYGAGTGAGGGALYANYQTDWTAIDQSRQYSGTPPTTDYIGQTEVLKAGSISGTVSWASPPKAPDGIETPVAGCDGVLTNETLQIDKRGRVGNAVVYLSDIKTGKNFATTGRYNIQLGGSLEQHACALSPHVQMIAPAGSPLKVTNSDTSGRTFTGTLWDGEQPRPDSVFEMTLRPNAASKKTNTNYYGFLRVSTTKPTMPSSAWVVVPPHPYYVITDDQGGFRLDDVPAGTYRLTVWHEPVIVDVDASGTPILSAPIIQTSKVVVRARTETRTAVKLKKL